MKTFWRSFALLSLSVLLFSTTASENKLIKLNKYWKNVPCVEELSRELKPTNEVQLIQFHFRQVIDSLNRVDLSDYTAQQIENRSRLLGSLEVYQANGVFPINSYHLKRTPYFIDNNGTACAVGHLIIESGRNDLAQLISCEDNYAYIEEMNFKELPLWANEHGFSIEELMWIQPNYGPTCPIGTYRNACPTFQGPLGCIYPNIRTLPPGSSYLGAFYLDTNNQWVLDPTNMWSQAGFVFPAQWQIRYQDSLGNPITFSYNIIQYPVIQFQTTVVNASASQCNGEVHVSVSQGIPPYTYSLYDAVNNVNVINTTNDTLRNLCQGRYRLQVTDSASCYQSSQSFYIQMGTALNEINRSNLSPFFKSDQIILPETGLRFEIYNTLGKKQMASISQTNYIDISSIMDGVYILVLTDRNNQSKTYKFLKN